MGGTLGRLWLGGFAFFLSFYLLLGALPLYARGVGVADRAIGLVIGCFAFASMVMKPWAGWASDRYGRRPLILAGAAVFVTASIAYGFSAGVWELVLVRLLHGAGMGLFPTAASAVVADVAPPERRGEYLGFFGAAANIAMAVGPILGIIVSRRTGFAALFALSAVAALLGLVVLLRVPETLGEARTGSLRPAAMLSRAAAFPSLVVACLMVTYGAQIAFLPIYADAHGINPGLFFFVFALVVALVRSHAGRLSDRMGRVPVAAAGLGLSALALVTLVSTASVAGLAVAGAVYGVGFGTAQPALMAWCVDRVPAADRGRAMGTYYMALELGIAAGAGASGLAVSAVGFAMTFLAVAAIALAGGGLAMTARRAPLGGF